MYKVDVSKLKNKLENLNSLLETYQENYLNMYYQIETSQNEEYWVDPHAEDFFEDKTMEKSNIEESYEELNEVYDLVNEIINMYSSLGETIDFDLTNRSSVLSKFNVYKNKLRRIYNSYKDLDYGFASSDIVSEIDSQMSNIREQLALTSNLKDNITDIMDDIKKYESSIGRMVKRIYISKLQSVDVEKYCTRNNNEYSDRCLINIEEINNTTKKMSLYNDLESSNFLSILNTLKGVIDAYKTTNTASIGSLRENLSYKFESIKDLNTSNIQVYDRNVDTYSRVDKAVTADAKNNIGA